MKTYIVSTLLLSEIALWYFSATAWAQVAPSADVKFVAAGIANGCQQLQNARVEATYTSFVPREATLTGQQEEKASYTIKWASRPLQRYLKVFVGPATPEENKGSRQLSETIAIQDGIAKVLQQYEEIPAKPAVGSKLAEPVKPVHFDIGAITDSDSVLKNDLPRTWSFLDPRYYAYYTGTKPLEELILEYPSAIKGEEVLEGSKCLRIEVNLNPDVQDIYWIDTEHGYLVRRSQTFERSGRTMVLRHQVTVSALLESSGSWLPASVKHESFVDFRSPGTTKVQTVTILRQLHVTLFKGNESMPDDSSALIWPTGTNINDRLKQKRYVVYGLDASELAKLNDFRRKKAEKLLEALPITPEDVEIENRWRRVQKLPLLKQAIAAELESDDMTALDGLRLQTSKANTSATEH